MSSQRGADGAGMMGDADVCLSSVWSRFGGCCVY
jgi:hypothetical protein